MECDLLMIKIEKVINKKTLRHLSLFRHHFIPMIQTGYPLYSLNAASICLRRIRGRTISSGRRGWQKSGADSWAYYRANRYLAPWALRRRYRSFRNDWCHWWSAGFAALFGAAEAWLKSQGASKISGPFSLNINQESGLLIEGFDTPPCAMMPHGKPWYAAHIEQLGYHKGIDLLAWWMQRTDLTFSPALKNWWIRCAKSDHSLHQSPAVCRRDADPAWDFQFWLAAQLGICAVYRTWIRDHGRST